MKSLSFRKFKFVIPENKKTNYTWNTEDPTVPDGKQELENTEPVP